MSAGLIIWRSRRRFVVGCRVALLALTGSFPSQAQPPGRGPGPLPPFNAGALEKPLSLTEERAARVAAEVASFQHVLTESQQAKLQQALFAARFGQGPGGSGPRAAVPADQPAPRTDENSRKAHQQLLAKRQQGKIDLYFLGDSITRRWGATDYPDLLAHWRKTFHGWNAANFGWGADALQNMLWRLDHGELDGVNPKVIVFLGGTNNIGDRPGDDAKAAEIARGIKAVLGRLQQKAPEATIVLTSILPRGTDPNLHTFIQKINASMATLADGSKVRYLDAFPKFADPSGKLTPGAFTSDNLHLSLEGYQLWASLLTPVLTELLGPKAAEDHAPPPTGDPSAAVK